MRNTLVENYFLIFLKVNEIMKLKNNTMLNLENVSTYIGKVKSVVNILGKERG